MTFSKYVWGLPSCRASTAGAPSVSADADGIVRVAALGQRPCALLHVPRKSRGRSIGYPREPHRKKLVHHAGAEGGTLARSWPASGATYACNAAGDGDHSRHEHQGVVTQAAAPSSCR